MAEKGVHFGSSTVIGPCACDEENVCQDDLWYDSNDYRYFKTQFVTQAKKVARFSRTSHQCEHGNLFLKMFHACCEDDKTSTKAPTFSQALVPSEFLQDSDESSSQDGSEHGDDESQVFTLGLERMAARQIAKDKPKRRHRLLRAILKLQSKHTSVCDQVNEEALRSVCERISRPSRLFAQHLAQVVAEAA